MDSGDSGYEGKEDVSSNPKSKAFTGEGDCSELVGALDGALDSGLVVWLVGARCTGRWSLVTATKSKASAKHNLRAKVTATKA